MTPETIKEQIERVERMASGEPTWDLSYNDRAALSALLSALRESEGEATQLREAIRLDGEDAEFYFLSDPEGRLFVNLNDTFGYAVADAEPIPWDEFNAVIAEWRRDARTLLVWAARKRGQDVAALASDGRVPKRTREALAGWLAERPRAAGREG